MEKRHNDFLNRKEVKDLMRHYEYEKLLINEKSSCSEGNNMDKLFEVFNTQTKVDVYTGSDYINKLQFEFFFNSDINQALNVQEKYISCTDFP